MASRLPSYVIFASQAGILDDADISEGSTSFGIDQTAAIQALLDRNIDGGYLVYIHDVRCSISSELYINSYTTIDGMYFGGFIFRNNSNRWMFRNRNFNDATDTPSLDDNVDRNITFQNITINGNAYNTGYSVPGDPDGAAQKKLTGNELGYVGGVILSGVDNLIFNNVKWIRHRGYSLHMACCQNIINNNPVFDCGPTLLANMDGQHHAGPIKNVTVNNPYLRTGDDGMSFTADDIPYLGIYPRPFGDIEHVRINNILVDGSRISCVRLLSATHAIRDVQINGGRGTTNGFSFIADCYPNNDLVYDGPGHFSDIHINDWKVEVLADHVDAITDACMIFDGNFDGLTIEGVTRNNYFDTRPTMKFWSYLNDTSKTFNKVKIINYEGNNTTGNALNHLQFDHNFTGGLQIVDANVSSSSASSGTTIASFTKGTTPRLSISGMRGKNIGHLVSVTGTADVQTIDAVQVVSDSPAGSASTFLLSGATVDELTVSNHTGASVYSGTATVTVEKGDAFL